MNVTITLSGLTEDQATDLCRVFELMFSRNTGFQLYHMNDNKMRILFHNASPKDLEILSIHLNKVQENIDEDNSRFYID